MSKVRTPKTPQAPVEMHSEKEILRFAVTVSGSEKLAREWFKRPTPLLGNQSPEEAVRDGKGKAALGILQNVAGV